MSDRKVYNSDCSLSLKASLTVHPVTVKIKELYVCVYSYYVIVSVVTTWTGACMSISCVI